MIEFIKETGSTSADIAARLHAGEYVPEGHWLVADRQTAGRGRQSREWFDGGGNFMGSTVVHLRSGDPEPPSLSLLAGLAVYEAVSAKAGAPAAMTLKWPNDVMVGDAKLAGILLERIGDAVVVGIGVNLVSAPQLPDRATVSLVDLGVTINRDAFAEDLARTFDFELERWRNYGLAPIIKRWLAVAHPKGTPLTAYEPGEAPLSGTFVGLGDDGSLQLRLADGSSRAIHAGEVSLSVAGK